ncbi:MAG TPA: O-antigen polymerase, partial [bacterium]|nr:O-antigen polymerase [bacterium]
ILVFSFLLFRKNAGTMAFNKINMISYIFYVQMFLMSFIGALLVVNNIDNHYLISRLTSENPRYYGWLAVNYSMIAMPLGMLFSSFLLKEKDVGELLKRYGVKNVEPIVSKNDSYLRLLLLFLSSISIISVCYTFYSIGSMPVLSLLSGESSKFLARLRIEASLEFGGNIYVRNIFAIALTPVLSYISFGYYKMTKSRFDLFWFLIMLFFSLLISTYSLAKSPLLTYLLGFFLLKILVDGKVSRKVIVFSMISLLSLLIFLYISVMGSNLERIPDLFIKFNEGISGRILLSQSAGTFFSFDIFPVQNNFLGFSSFSNVISEIFSIDKSDRSARIIMSIIMPSAIDDGTGGVINSLFVGEAWANFGLIGVLLSPFWVGFVIQWSYISILRSKKTPIFLALMVYLTLKWPITGGFNDFIYNAGIVMMFLVFSLIIFFSIFLRIINTGERYFLRIRADFKR